MRLASMAIQLQSNMKNIFMYSLRRAQCPCLQLSSELWFVHANASANIQVKVTSIVMELCWHLNVLNYFHSQLCLIYMSKFDLSCHRNG
jgi:hypothetical protein